VPYSATAQTGFIDIKARLFDLFVTKSSKGITLNHPYISSAFIFESTGLVFFLFTTVRASFSANHTVNTVFSCLQVVCSVDLTDDSPGDQAYLSSWLLVSQAGLNHNITEYILLLKQFS
jgi:hypothetical protein